MQTGLESVYRRDLRKVRRKRVPVSDSPRKKTMLILFVCSTLFGTSFIDET